MVESFFVQPVNRRSEKISTKFKSLKLDFSKLFESLKTKSDNEKYSEYLNQIEGRVLGRRSRSIKTPEMKEIGLIMELGTISHLSNEVVRDELINDLKSTLSNVGLAELRVQNDIKRAEHLENVAELVNLLDSISEIDAQLAYKLHSIHERQEKKVISRKGVARLNANYTIKLPEYNSGKGETKNNENDRVSSFRFVNATEF